MACAANSDSWSLLYSEDCFILRGFINPFSDPLLGKRFVLAARPCQK
jgi:hypothetical protein